LTALLRDWQRRTDDTQPLTSPNPKPAEFDFSQVKTTPPQKPKRSQ
jgi:hypothetical protein